jgi:hypothetical protein
MIANDFFCICDMPLPPAGVVAEIVASIKNDNDPQFTIRKTITDRQLKVIHNSSHFFVGKEKYSRAMYRRYNLGKLTDEWIRDNIASEYSQMGSQVMRNGDAFFPHTDGGPRRYILNYLIDTGGEQVETRWYQQPGYNLYREGDAMQWPDNSNLNVVHTEIFPVKSWTMLFGKVIHGVVGLTSPRMQLSISFSAEEFLKLKERHGIMLSYHE